MEVAGGSIGLLGRHDTCERTYGGFTRQCAQGVLAPGDIRSCMVDAFTLPVWLSCDVQSCADGTLHTWYGT